MGQFMGVNAIHLNYLDPLMKWKIMDVQSLLRYSKCQAHYGSFMRIITKLQSLSILKSLIDPISRKKYVYLTEEGIKLTSASNKLVITNEHSPEHDAKASEITRQFLESRYVEKVLLDHELYSKNSIIPDASLMGEKNGKSFSIAFEFELNRKAKERVIAKIRNYFLSTDYDYVMYFFSSKSLQVSYEKFIREELDGKYVDRIMFVYHPAVMWGKFPIAQAEVIFKSERKVIAELFR